MDKSSKSTSLAKEFLIEADKNLAKDQHNDFFNHKQFVKAQTEAQIHSKVSTHPHCVSILGYEIKQTCEYIMTFHLFFEIGEMSLQEKISEEKSAIG